MTQKIAMILAALALAIGHGCTGGFQSGSIDGDGGGTATSVDPGALNQAPKVGCTVLNKSTGTVRTLNTVSSLDTFFPSNPIRATTLSFDCSGTNDEDGIDKLSFEIDTDFDPEAPQFVPLSGPAFDLPLPNVGAFPMALKVIDSDGSEQIKTFSTIVRCEEEIVPQVTGNPVMVSPSGKLNFFNYGVNSGALSGGTSFEFSWDFNGDGVYDPFSMMTPNDTWTNQTQLQNIYTIFASTADKPRRINLKIRNECMNEVRVTADVAFTMQNIARTPEAKAEKRGYYYLQSDISGLPLTDQRVNGDYIATQYPEDQEYERVRCDYKFKRLNQPAVFSIIGYNWYKGGSATDGSSTFIHGSEIRIQGIADKGIVGLQEFTSAQGAKITTSTYRASAADDGMNAENYSRIDIPCTVTIRVERADAVAPCAPNLKEAADFTDKAVILLGEFNCPKMTDTATGRSVAAENGKFFCEVHPSNQCVGGGGGGGGQPPPQQ